jgi:undecaprenyl-diphosphatase
VTKLSPKSSWLWCAALIAVLAVAAIIFYLYFDNRIALNVFQNPPAWANTDPFNAFKQLGKTEVVIWVIIVWALIRRSPKLAVAGLISLALVAAIVTPLKASIDRARPKPVLIKQLQPNEYMVPRKNTSFPSGDTATAFAAAISVGMLARRRWLLLLIPSAAMIGLLRVLASAHYPSDVCVGAAIGVLAGWLGTWIYNHFRILQSAWSETRPVYFVCWLYLAVLPVVALCQNNQALRLFFSYFGLVALILAAIALVIYTWKLPAKKPF